MFGKMERSTGRQVLECGPDSAGRICKRSDNTRHFIVALKIDSRVGERKNHASLAFI
jgi:hypothetical protein